MRQDNIVCQLKENSFSQMMSYVIMSKGEIAVVDGGTVNDATSLLDFLYELSDGNKPVVSKWMFTHAHHDHMCSVIEIMKNHADKIEVKDFYYNFGDYDFAVRHCYEAYEFKGVEFLEAAKKFTSLDKLHIVKTGDKIELGDSYFEVLRTPDKQYANNVMNNCSVVYMLNMSGQKVLFLGDTGIEAGNEMLEKYTHGELKADFVQMAHHGQNGVTEEFYKEVAPKACFWTTPLWLWNNDAGRGYNTHVFQTIVTRGWMENLGVKENYKTHEGTAIVTFPHKFD